VGIDNGLRSSDPGLGINTRRAGIGRNVASRSCTSNSSRSRSTPYSSTSAIVIWSMPGAPALRRTCPHARCRTSLRWTLSYSAWNRRPGSALAARYSACCKARTASSSRSIPGVGLAQTALTGHSLSTCTWTKQRPFPHRRLCCPPGSTGTTAASDAVPAGRPLPGSTPVIERHAPPTSTSHRAGDGLPCSRHHRLSVPRPLRRGVLHGCTSRYFTASMAFALKDGARLSLDPAPRGHFHDAAGFA